MKKYILLSTLAIGLLANAFGQKPTMELTFTAEDNGFYVPLDSIFIENLTKEVDTILYAPDTVLVLDYITGIGDNDAIEKNTLTVSQNYPNPFKGKTAFDLYLPEKENITITGRDILGRELMHRAYALNRGNHSFAFYAGNESYYLITVTGKQTSQTIKMMNAGSKSSNGEKCKLVYTGGEENTSGFKSKNEKNNFVFEPGDGLRYTGYAITVDGVAGNAVIYDVPESNVDYEFAIFKGYRCPDTPTVKDIDGNVYNTVQIGDQCWTAENLKTRTYTDGTPIPNLTDPNAWWFATGGAYVWYDNDFSWKETYGALYNWYTGLDPRGLCPTGWHVPDDDEWTELTDFIGGTGVPHGTELKSCRQVNSPWGDACNTTDHPRWDDSGNSIYGTDDYGFSLLPGGYRVGLGDFQLLGQYGAWWTTTEYSFFFSWGRAMFWDTGHMGVFYDYKEVGRSIRCLKDNVVEHNELDLKVFLEGPFNGTDMVSDLISLENFPLQQPYNTSPWNYSGTESITTVPINTVDWVLVELRDAVDANSATEATIIETMAGLLTSNGRIVNIDGYSNLEYSSTITNNLFVTIHHRNHISIMSGNPVASAGNLYSYNFTTDETQVYGNADGHKELSPGIWGMMSGNGLVDFYVDDFDISDSWDLEAGESGYLQGDFNLDSQVDNKDKDDFWLPNNGSGSQVPE